jgi:cytoplasmic tRNA 2-thiolation protein 2
MPAKQVDVLCRRCHTLEAILTVRSELLCRECFVKYVYTKVVKRMDAFRTRHLVSGVQRKLLLPISFGVSSTTLLFILDQHLRSQVTKTGRTGFALHVLYITDPFVAKDMTFERLESVKTRFPNYEFSTMSLEEYFAGNISKRPSNNETNTNGNLEDYVESHSSKLESFLHVLPSTTSRTDVLSMLRTRATAQFAKDNHCEGIIWGDSTTKLAEKILSETAKGRGFALSWHVADGESPYGVAFYYPMRDVLKKELLAHVDLVQPSLRPLILEEAFLPTKAPPSAKNTTIDVLMQQYFESVEENYPNIVSNVIRTTEKLQLPAIDGQKLCGLCKLPVTDDLLGMNGWGGDQTDATTLERPEISQYELCYGCARSVPQEAIGLLPG